jgi:hypothetical protein
MAVKNYTQPEELQPQELPVNNPQTERTENVSAK